MADIKPISVPSKRLASSITSSSSSFQLDNIKGWDGIDLTSSDFGSIAYVVFRNEANTILELFEFDPATIASSSITINKRGLKFTGDLTTQVSGNKKTWVKNSTIVELGSNPPQLLKHYLDTISAQTISGVKTFSVLPKITAGDPVADDDIARKSYVDLVVAGSFPSERLVVAGTAGETVADGDFIYFDESDNEWKLADASTSATSEAVLLGIAQGAGTNGNAITGGVLLQGLDDSQAGMTIGDVMYLSDVAGDIGSSPGTIEVNIGIAKSATEIYFSPRFLHFLTEDEQDALVGDLGTPNSNNKYLTQESLGKVDQSQTTTDGTTKVGEADATTKHNKVAQSFIPTVKSIASVDLWKIADTSSFTGTVTVSLQADSSGSPSGSALATHTITNADWLLLVDAAQFNIRFNTAYTAMTVGNTYWIVIETSTSDNSNHPNLGRNAAGGYANGSAKFNNTTDGWTVIATIDLYFRTFTHYSISNFDFGFADDTGSNDTYVVTLDPAPTSWFQGMRFSFQANTVNTGACTINPNGLGAKSLKTSGGNDPADGAIIANGIVDVIYDGVNAVINTPLVATVLDFGSDAGVSISATDTGGSPDTTDDTTTAVTLSVARRCLLIFSGRFNVNDTAQNKVITIVFNIDSGTLIQGASFTRSAGADVVVESPVSSNAVTAVLSAGSHNFNMRVTMASSASASMSIVGTLYIIGL